MSQSKSEVFVQISESTLYVQGDDLEQACAVCESPARRFNRPLGEFFCSERCVRLDRVLSQDELNLSTGEAIVPMASRFHLEV